MDLNELHGTQEKLAILQNWGERLRRSVIGEPVMPSGKGAFEYPEVGVKVVSIIKMMRAIASLKAMFLLNDEGLFVDSQSLFRCHLECIFEIGFMLEKYPEVPPHVEKFLIRFKATDFESYLDNPHPAV